MTTTEQETITVGRITYQVVRTANENIPYELYGPRGARYGLMRNVPNPRMLFMFNLKGFTKRTPDVWFTDRNGRLEVVR